jgi:hypothetical protein
MAMSRLPSLRRDKNYAQHRGGSIASWLHKEVVAWCPSNFVDLYPDEIPGKIEEVGISSFYIHRGFYAATRPPGALRRPGSPSQAL